jgi:putative glutamine amidotransferase
VPVILATCSERLAESYQRAVAAAGASLRVLSAADGAWAAARPEDALAGVDGLLLTGGGDVDPSWYGSTLRHPRTRPEPARDALEIALCAAAMARDMPLLGICRGIQVWNVAEGGTLWQDLSTQRQGSLCHMEAAGVRDRRRLLHDVVVRGAAAAWLAGPRLRVNSIHHQAVREVGPRLRVLATAPDGVIEAVAAPDRRFAVAVQWHPEELSAEGDDPRHRGLFQALCAAARRARPYQPRSNT